MLAVRWSEIWQEVGYQRQVVALAKVGGKDVARNRMIPLGDAGSSRVREGRFEYGLKTLRESPAPINLYSVIRDELMRVSVEV